MHNEFLKSKNIQYRIFDKKFYNTINLTLADENNNNAVTKLARRVTMQAIPFIKDIFKAENIIMLNQIHSSTVFECKEEAINSIMEIDGDAIVTSFPKLCLAVQTADCTPIIAYDNNKIAAIHAGWKGALNGIVQNTLAKFDKFNTNVLIGPCIFQESYEVSQEFYQCFLDQSILNSKFFKNSKRLNHYFFDLPGYIKALLVNLGVKNIYQVQHNTYKMEDMYPSFRRSTHLGSKLDCHLITAIMMV